MLRMGNNNFLFILMVVINQLGKCINAIRSDRDDKYLLGDFKDYLTKNGIIPQLTAPRTPQ